MDDLDELLAPMPQPMEWPCLRTAIFGQAGRVQRRRRWLVRGRRVVVLAACYAAGLATMWYWPLQMPPPRPVVAANGPIPPSPNVDPFRNDPPERLEKWAFIQTGEKRSQLYRRAGDGYLGHEEVEAALRCYRKALDGGSTADLAIRADSDSWLLMSLKIARQKENPRARVN